MATQGKRKAGVAVAAVSASLTPRSQSLPQLLPLAQSDAASAAKCRGEFCGISPAALPGLYGTATENNEQDDAAADDDADADGYGDGSEDAGLKARRRKIGADRDVVFPDTGQRFKIGNNNLLLARAEMKFLLGHVQAPRSRGPSGDEKSICLLWQEADNVHRMELGRSNPAVFYKQVGVCPNCHRIYADLAKFRENGFRRKGATASAWNTAHENEPAAAKSNGVTVKRGGDKGRATRTKGGEYASAEPTEYYDQLFLSELAKHMDDRSTDQNETPSPESSARSEHEAIAAHVRSASSASSEGLPSLNPPLSKRLSAGAPIKKKAPEKADDGRSRLVLNSENNQQASVSSNNLSAKREVALVELESTVRGLRDEVADKKSRVALLEQQKLQLEHKLLQAHTQCTAMLQEKEDEYRKKILELELESVTKQSAEQRFKGDKEATNSASDVAQLIETIDSLNCQLDKANSEKDLILREVKQGHLLEIKRLHDKYQVEMESLRLSEYTAKEQAESAQLQMTHFQNEFQLAAAQARSAKSSLDDLTKNKLPILEEKSRFLERQLAELKSVHSKAANSAPPSKPSQDYTAMEKHLNNKVEYLKAQLASEMKCKEELGNHLAQITTSMELLKKEKRSALAEQEEAFKRHTERLEANAALEKDALQSQYANLQGKVATLQANVTDLVQELTMWKTKESNSKLALEKMAEESVRLTRQIVDLEAQVETLHEERRHDGGNNLMSAKNANDETQRMQLEALMRRLDNERQYLKNQVDNEAEMRGQFQAQVITLQDELCELRQKMEDITRSAEQRLSTLAAAKVQQERQLMDEKVALEEGKQMLSKQLKEIQIKSIQAREQSLLEKDELEKARIELNEMRSLLENAKQELAKEREYGKTSSDRMSRALSTIKSSLKAMEDEKNLRIKRLEEENAVYLQKLARAQGDMLVLEEKWADDKQSIRRGHALHRIALVLREKFTVLETKQKAAAYLRLRLVASRGTIQDDMASRYTKEQALLEAKLSQEYVDKLEDVTQSLHHERMEAIASLNLTHEKDRLELQQFYDQEKSQLEEDLRSMHGRQMQELEDQYEQTIRDIDERSAAAVSSLQGRCEDLRSQKETAEMRFTEARSQCEQLSTSMRLREEDISASIQAKEAAWMKEKDVLEQSVKLRVLELTSSFEQQAADSKDAFESELNALKATMAEVDKMNVERVREELAANAKGAEDALIMRHKQEIADLNNRHQTLLEHETAQLKQHWQRELERQRIVHDATLKHALERVELKAQGHLETIQKEMNDRKATSLLQCTAKWQKAMEDLQARCEVEKKMAYDSGLQDRENEWQQAANQIKQKQKDELENVQMEAVRAIQAAEERHKMLLQAQIAQMANEYDDRFQKESDTLIKQISDRELLRGQTAMEQALDQLTASLKREHAEEIIQLREDWTEDHQAKLKQLQEAFTYEKHKLSEAHGRELVDLRTGLEQDWSTKFEEMQQSQEYEKSNAVAQLRDQLTRHFDELCNQQEQTFTQELHEKLKEQEERLLNEQEDAITQVQEDSERLIEQVEVAMTELKKQKDGLEKELTRLRGALEEAEDSHFDLEEKLKKEQKQAVFHIMTLVMLAERKFQADRDIETQKLMEAQKKQDRAENEVLDEKKQRIDELTVIKTAWRGVQACHNEMLQTLTNYKRDELVAHRSASSVLSNEISIVVKQMDEVFDMKDALEKEIEQLQAEAQGVEESLRQLMVQTTTSTSRASGSDGVNMAIVAKKRRLNEEFESLLERMEKKKGEVRNIEKTLASLRQRREEKESEVKVMERKLVEILVGQQKQMLSLLNAVREVALPTALATVSAG